MNVFKAPQDERKLIPISDITPGNVIQCFHGEYYWLVGQRSSLGGSIICTCLETGNISYINPEILVNLVSGSYYLDKNQP